MIKPRIAESTKVLLVFDTCMHVNWDTQGKINEQGIAPLLKRFMAAGVPITEISAVCLSDTLDKPKSSDYKAKIEQIKEVLETYSFNLVITVGAGAFEKMAGIKGAAKYFGRTLYSEIYPEMKLLPCPSPAAAKYDPGVWQTISKVAVVAAVEKESSTIEQKDKLPTHYKILDTIEKVREFFRYFQSTEITEFAYDLETTGLNFNIDEITTIQFSHKPGYSYLIPCRTIGDYPAAPYKWEGDGEWEEILNNCKLLFADPNKVHLPLVIGHNKKFDDKFLLHHWGIPLQKGRSWDTMLASFLCDENTPNGLKDLTCQLTDMGDYELELEKFKDAYCKKHKLLKKPSTKYPEKPVFSYSMIPFEILAPYALCDTDATIRLYHHFKDELVKEEQEETFKILTRISWLMTRFELNGWPINVAYGNELKEKLIVDIAELKQELMQYPEIKKAEILLSIKKLEKENEKRKVKLTALKEPLVFNLGSPDQKSMLFFNVMKLPVVSKSKKTKKPSTDKEAVSTWMRSQPKHKEFLQGLQRYMEMCKFLSTYVIGILSKTVNGRVHPSFNPIGCKTGRSSSSGPNFQNIPARGDDRKMKLVKSIKKMIEAPEGRTLLGADLSGIEMRWACIVSGDTKLTEIFNGDGLVHEAVAQELFDYIKCERKDIKKLYEFERNSVSKTVQFLSIFGGGGDALAKKVNESIIERQEMAKAKGETLVMKVWTKDDGQKVLDNYFKKYSGVNRYIMLTEQFANKNGYTVSPYGYRRRVPAVTSTDEGIKAQAIRQAINATIQNPASISLLLGMCNLQEEIDEKGYDIKLLGSIHDAGYAEPSDDMLIQGRDLLLSHITAPPIPNCPIPIEAEAEHGRTWADFSTDFGNALIEQDETEEDEDELEEN